MEQSEKQCGNCKYFSGHYRIAGGKLCKVKCGICTNDDMRRSEKTRRMFRPGCPHWQDGSAEALQCAKDINEAFAQAVRALVQIALILEEEKDADEGA